MLLPIVVEYDSDLQTYTFSTPTKLSPCVILLFLMLHLRWGFVASTENEEERYSLEDITFCCIPAVVLRIETYSKYQLWRLIDSYVRRWAISLWISVQSLRLSRISHVSTRRLQNTARLLLRLHTAMFPSLTPFNLHLSTTHIGG